MTDTTLDEAKRCPKCEEPGRPDGSRGGPNRSTVYTYRCMNGRCKWYDTTYIVQVNADGTIPDPTTHRQKNFPAMPARSDEAVEKYNQFLLNQTLAGGETRYCAAR